ncbi:MAG: hypothetical protein HY756_05530 [Nitrospirae bacterium]|nr:hypothetical protein [Nitrospirota bacterium]
MKNAIFKRLWVFMLTVSLLLPSVAVIAAGKGGEEELKERIEITNKKRVTQKEKMRFEERLKSYFFEIVDFAVIESAMKELTPGEALAVIVIVEHSKKPGKEIIKMRKEGKSWTDISKAVGVNMKDIINGVKEFQKMSGCG